MKIAIIGTVGLPANYGGFETLANFLVKFLHQHHHFTVYCSSYAYPSKPKQHSDADLRYIPFRANGIQSILYDIVSMTDALFRCDALLILGVSGCIALPFIKLIWRKRIIVNIDGIEWKRDKWSRTAKAFLQFSEKIAVRFADVIIADNEKIQEYIEATYKRESHVIEYGADHVLARQAATMPERQAYPFLDKPYGLSVCRIEPENNVHIMLAAFAAVQNMLFVMIGNWNNSTYGRALRVRYAGIDNVILLDPIYDQHKIDLIRSNCFLYIHGHSAGGTNPSLVEAMFLGLPVIAFDVDYNRVTTENHALYFSDKQDLVRIIRNLDASTLRKTAQDLHEIALRRYRWEVIASKYERLFLA